MGAHLPGQAVLLTRRASQGALVSLCWDCTSLEVPVDRANGACSSHRDASHPLIVQIRYVRRVIYRGLGGVRAVLGAASSAGAPSPAFSHPSPRSSNPTSSYTLRGCFGGDLVFWPWMARKYFPQNSFVWGRGGVGSDFDSRPYKKCAHFAHFEKSPYRVGRDGTARGARPPTTSGRRRPRGPTTGDGDQLGHGGPTSQRAREGPEAAGERDEATDPSSPAHLSPCPWLPRGRRGGRKRASATLDLP